MNKFLEFRDKYKSFSYESFTIKQSAGEIALSFRFVINDLGEFNPKIKIRTDNLKIVNSPDSAAAKKIVFSLGLVEAVSYWKSACPPEVLVKCGSLSSANVNWWKRLWWGGLGEFFFCNGIETNFENFVNFKIENEITQSEKAETFTGSGLNLIPIGGGKDSCVTADLLRDYKDKNMFFTVNDQPARTQCVETAGYSVERIIRTHRTIDPALLDLNRRGFLNGHTPFSAIVAFLSFYCAYITGAENIILSNESSANEGNVSLVPGVNHQYSKSFEFENDFIEYSNQNLVKEISYFSLLRPFNELQITKKFASLSQYHSVFKSCNRGSKKNIWCGECSKCLFVFIMLSAFLKKEEVIKIFGKNMFENEELSEVFDALCGVTEVKPFECVGTAREIQTALKLTLHRRYDSGDALEPLLSRFLLHSSEVESEIALLKEYNGQNNVPQHFQKAIGEMYSFVSAID